MKQLQKNNSIIGRKKDIADEMFLFIDLMKVFIEKAPLIAYCSLLKIYGFEHEEFAKKLHLTNNGAHKVMKTAKTLITAMLRNGIDSIDGNVQTNLDDYYRTKAQAIPNPIMLSRVEIITLTAFLKFCISSTALLK